MADQAAGFFQGFAVSTSASRTAVAERSGAGTQLTGVTGAALIIVMIVFVPGLFRNLPSPALAAVVITVSLASPHSHPAWGMCRNYWPTTIWAWTRRQRLA